MDQVREDGEESGDEDLQAQHGCSCFAREVMCEGVWFLPGTLGGSLIYQQNRVQSLEHRATQASAQDGGASIHHCTALSIIKFFR